MTKETKYRVGALNSELYYAEKEAQLALENIRVLRGEIAEIDAFNYKLIADLTVSLQRINTHLDECSEKIGMANIEVDLAERELKEKENETH